jgi:uncharacterized protein
MLAAYNGHAALVQGLLERGADANRVNDRGQSPLAGVVFKGFDEIARVLVAAGADPELGTPTATQTAQMFNRTQLLALFQTGQQAGQGQGQQQENDAPPPPAADKDATSAS